MSTPDLELKTEYLFIKELETETRGAITTRVWSLISGDAGADTRCHPIACVGSRGLGQMGGVPHIEL